MERPANFQFSIIHFPFTCEVDMSGENISTVRGRRSIRLRGYDYSLSGAYFVTICTQNRKNLYGDIVDGKMNLNDAGKMVQTVWDEIPSYYPGTEIDEFIIMPNHIHAIIIICNHPVGAGPRACPNPDFGSNPGPGPNPNENDPRDDGHPRDCGHPRGGAPTELRPTDGQSLSLPDVVHRFKTMTTTRYIDGVKQHGWPRFSGKLWQRNYWEHIVRNESDLKRIREYIRNNPQKWESDCLRGSSTDNANIIRERSVEYTSEAWMV